VIHDIAHGGCRTEVQPEDKFKIIHVNGNRKA
jgi:hypothetical protein